MRLVDGGQLGRRYYAAESAELDALEAEALHGGWDEGDAESRGNEAQDGVVLGALVGDGGLEAGALADAREHIVVGRGDVAGEEDPGLILEEHDGDDVARGERVVHWQGQQEWLASHHFRPRTTRRDRAANECDVDQVALDRLQLRLGRAFD